MNKVVIIGAPRSGTNMLRDMLTQLQGVNTWPCDEINYIWRHGNVHYPSDCFTRDMATDSVKRYINGAFEKFARETGSDTIVEKTCANSLRVGFVDEVLPDAKYIFIVRDGADAIGSAKLRWTAELDLPYLFKKVKYVPLFDLPIYGSRYLRNRIDKVFSKDKSLSYWGPLLQDMDRVKTSSSVYETCAYQWLECVTQSSIELSGIASERVYQLKYEDFVSNPAVEFKKVSEFIGKSPSEEAIKNVVGNTSSKSLGKGRSQIPTEQLHSLSEIVDEQLISLGYKPLAGTSDV